MAAPAALQPRRVLPFLSGCMVVRVGLVALAYWYPRLLPVLGILASGLGVGFIVIWSARLRQTGFETAGARIWWDALRPVHGVLYLTFAALALGPSVTRRHAWKLLAADVVIGLTAWLVMVSAAATVASPGDHP